MNIVLQIMIALAILVPPNGTKEIVFHQRAAGKEYVNDVKYILRKQGDKKYTLSFRDCRTNAPDAQSIVPDLSVSVFNVSQHEYLVKPIGKDKHPYLTSKSGKEHTIQLATLVEIPAGQDLADVATLRQVMFPEADGLIRLTHDKPMGQLTVKWPTNPHIA